MGVMTVSDYTGLPLRAARLPKRAAVPGSWAGKLERAALELGVKAVTVKFVGGFENPNQLGRTWRTPVWGYIELHEDLAGPEFDKLEHVFAHECAHLALGHLSPIVPNRAATGAEGLVPVQSGATAHERRLREGHRRWAEREAEDWAVRKLAEYRAAHGRGLLARAGIHGPATE